MEGFVVPFQKRRRFCVYLKKWEEQRPWLTCVPNDRMRAECICCKRQFSISHGGKSDVKQHEKTATHLRSLHSLNASKGNIQFYEKLIQEVKRCECLYVSSHPQFRDVQRHDAEWTVIGQGLGISGPEAQNIWRNLKSYYNRCISGEVSGSSSASAVIGGASWFLQEQMEFLKEHTSSSSGTLQDGSESNSSQGPYSADLSLEDIAGPTVKSEHENGFEIVMESAEPSSHLAQLSYKRKFHSVPSHSAFSSNHLLETDNDLEFFKGLLPSVRELSVSNKRLFKRRICNELFDLLESQDSDKVDVPIKTEPIV